jgi:misacylated tRNA(Ala) deacylase
MTELLYMTDSYLKEFNSTVTSVEGNSIEIDKTAFYPFGGGQPNDTGKLICDNQEFVVKDVRKKSGKIMHELDREGPKVGDSVHCIIDWNRRYKMMKMHTAAHLLSEVFHRGARALITGNQLDIDQSRIDYNLEEFDREKINQYCNKANEIIQQDLPIKVYSMKREEAMKIPAITKLASVLPPNIPELRIVEIVGFDTQADGGTHVNHLKEIGKIEIVKMENKGKDNRRVYYTLK